MSDETARLIERTADDLFAAESGAARQALAEGAWPERLWRTFAETGLAQAALPEDAGGAGLAAGLAVMRAAGRHAAPIPVAETMIAALLCHEAGVEPPAGPLTVYPVGTIQEDDLLATKQEDDPLTTVHEDRDPNAGALPRVPWARFASAFVAASSGGGLVLSSPAAVIEGANLAGEPRDAITDVGTVFSGGALPPALDVATLMALARAAQLRGAMEQVLAMTVAYAREREQFGRPLARFQAIQHHLAEIGGEAAATGAAVDAAAQAGTRFACAAAKARASQAAGTVARLAHQVHGAIGYTVEHDLHIWTTRLWAWREEYGNEAHWWQVLGNAVAQGGGAALWPTMVNAGRIAASEGENA